MLLNSPGLLPKDSTVIRPPFGEKLRAYTSKFSFLNVVVPVVGLVSLVTIDADPSRVGLEFIGDGGVVRVDTRPYTMPTDQHGVNLAAGVPLRFASGSDFDTVACQQEWFAVVDIGAWMQILLVSALPG